MSPFEYLLPFVSILVGLAVVDLSVSLHRLLRARRRITWDWLPLLAAAIVLLLVLEFWWSFYLSGRTEVWFRYGPFLLLTAILVNIFLLASAALPDEVPEEGLQLRGYYADNRRYFWSLFTLFIVLTVLSQLVPAVATGSLREVGVVAWVAGVVPNLALAALLLSLAFVRSRTYHAVLVPLLLLLLAWPWARLQLTDLP